ncbi:hypothetical protein B9Z55_024382 [Caenorhabditis nigoni]|nr:hypothetical protein B9Z55_024382 [Caenorhabditis nigoni]
MIHPRNHTSIHKRKRRTPIHPHAFLLHHRRIHPFIRSTTTLQFMKKPRRRLPSGLRINCSSERISYEASPHTFNHC